MFIFHLCDFFSSFFHVLSCCNKQIQSSIQQKMTSILQPRETCNENNYRCIRIHRQWARKKTTELESDWVNEDVTDNIQSRQEPSKRLEYRLKTSNQFTHRQCRCSKQDCKEWYGRIRGTPVEKRYIKLQHPTWTVYCSSMILLFL
jgi:hypothetical protein